MRALRHTGTESTHYESRKAAAHINENDNDDDDSPAQRKRVNKPRAKTATANEKKTTRTHAQNIKRGSDLLGWFRCTVYINPEAETRATDNDATRHKCSVRFPSV